jgi:hypothetical protein
MMRWSAVSDKTSKYSVFSGSETPPWVYFCKFNRLALLPVDFCLMWTECGH